MDRAVDNDDISVDTPHSDEPNVLSPPPPWTPLNTVFSFSSTGLLSLDVNDEARYLLVLQRRNQANLRPPESQIRHILRSKSRKELKSNEVNWKFNKHEVARALGSLFAENPLPRSGIAKALLEYAQPASVDEMWCHLHDQKLENRMKRRFGRRSTDKQIPRITWLDTAVKLGNLDYIELLCESSLGADPINHALGLALDSGLSFIGLEILLKHGAIAINFKDQVREYIQHRNDGFVQLLLSYPGAMTIGSWRYCLSPQIQCYPSDNDDDYPHILKRCLTELPGLASSEMILQALRSQNVAAVKLLLGSPSQGGYITDVHESASELACRIQDNNLRCECFTVLFESHFLEDGMVLRKELMRNVENRHLPLIRILVEAKISLDIDPYDATRWAASQLDYEILLLLKAGKLSKPASHILYSIPELASESDVLRVIDIFSPRGLEGEALSCRLSIAVDKEQSQLVARLLELGASVEYERARAIRQALGHADDTILKMLIRQPCSPCILSAAIPTAMALVSHQKRHAGMALMLNKGLPSENLGEPLRYLVRETGSDVNYDLIEALIKHGAPVDDGGDDDESPIILATKQGNPLLLHMLCKGEPNADSVSAALPFAVKLVEHQSLETSLQVLTVLFKHGAGGLLVHETLLAAAEDNGHQDSEFRIISLLLENGADPNYGAGGAYAAAIKHNSPALLVFLCEVCDMNRASLDAVLPLLVQPQNYNSLALSKVLRSSPHATISLNSNWVSESFREIVRHNPHILEIVSCSLDHGLNVDISNGILLRFAIREVNFEVLERLLYANPSLDSLRVAFHDANLIENRNVQLALIQLLLNQADSSEIGQSQELFTETAVALNGDTKGLRLLLYHRATVDFDDGKAVLVAASAGAVDVLDLLLNSGPSEVTIKKACMLVARMNNLDSVQKLVTLRHLLAANGGMTAECASDLLVRSVTEFPEYIEFPRQLLARGAIVQYTVLEVALKKGCSNLFSFLLHNTTDRHLFLRLFRDMHRCEIQIERKRWAYECLLHKGIPVNDISEAFIASLSSDANDVNLLELFIHYGAAVDYAHCAAFGLALRLNSPEVIRILCSNLSNDQETIGIAFHVVTHADSSAPSMQAEAYRLLLQKANVSKTLIQSALERSVAAESADASTVDILLSNGADPNTDGARCFFMAISAGAKRKFKILAKHANINSLLQALIGRFADEGKIACWFRICLEVRRESLTLQELHQKGLAFECMRKFPRGHQLLELLLEYRIIAPDATIGHSICPDWPPERCTILLWALSSSEPRIENDAILALLRAHNSEDCDGKNAVPCKAPLSRI